MSDTAINQAEYKPGIDPDVYTNLENERFSFSFILSVSVHVLLILGIGYKLLEPTDKQSTIDITLAQYRSNVAPDDPDFLAQQNQRGSGNLDEKVAPASPFEAPLAADQVNEVNPEPQVFQRQTSPVTPDSNVVLTTSDTENVVAIEPAPEREPLPEPEDLQNMDPEELTKALASLQAQLDLERQAYANRPRRYTISSASTRESYDALYLDSWRKRIETVGNLNYPDEAKGVYGNLRLLVAIRPDGSVEEVRVLRSSGHSELDSAAVNIVYMAAPFDPFPPEISSRADVLEVIRTWQFHRGNTFSTISGSAD